ncbi:hypothetical protein KEJ36_00050 [Candidatus Bathyarchaeota archaeon]|nr:hypothetical protein [Candidatus Bathyarchaeota archaeon]MBS7627216.1 hypothetical protein [Candidatus Bathyarchaeota archaeon]
MKKGEERFQRPIDLRTIYERLMGKFGSQGWWPAESTFEILIGAILTQRTNWKNVEKAMDKLKGTFPIEPKSIAEAPLDLLQNLIRSAGFYRQKAERLKAVASYICSSYGGSIEAFMSESLDKLRDELISIKGVGLETADSILLYAANKRIFPVDAYTRRIFGRLGFREAESLPYEGLRLWIQEQLPKNPDLFKEFRALIVRLAKDYCRKRPLCQNCPLGDLCEEGQRSLSIVK